MLSMASVGQRWFRWLFDFLLKAARAGRESLMAANRKSDHPILQYVLIYRKRSVRGKVYSKNSKALSLTQLVSLTVLNTVSVPQRWVASHLP